jgi:hypothetical protein
MARFLLSHYSVLDQQLLSRPAAPQLMTARHAGKTTGPARGHRYRPSNRRARCRGVCENTRWSGGPRRLSRMCRPDKARAGHGHPKNFDGRQTEGRGSRCKAISLGGPREPRDRIRPTWSEVRLTHRWSKQASNTRSHFRACEHFC